MVPPSRRSTLRSYAKANATECLEVIRSKRTTIQHIKAPSQSRRYSQLSNKSDGSVKNRKKSTEEDCTATVESNSFAKPSKAIELCNPDSQLPEMVGRVTERSAVRDFIRSAIEERRSATLYISGAPGTGKTAVVLHETHLLEKAFGCRVALINCMQLRSASMIYSHLIQTLRRSNSENSCTAFNVKSFEDTINRLVNRGTLVLILDEVDQLVSQSQDILYRIFNWPETLKCHIIVIGIANALDLPERLPKLKSKTHKPAHLTFVPYTRTELADIVTLKLGPPSDLKENSLDPLAIQLCARKISASTGDVRTALDVCRRAINLATQEAIRRNRNTEEQPSSVRPSLQHVSLALKELNVSGGVCAYVRLELFISFSPAWSSG
ncbi:unnamed protein product [Echinostoma caproni]|uniref:AAA domain-containing protein n=1 Tax=Echinostoma caproni TaxID=27848 RepID=A0A183B918_9TREM|nr:unnamed protein product [Echinostoma caproni]